MYINEGLSASKIAEKIGCSKSTVLAKLQSLNIRNGMIDGKVVKPKSQHKPNPPFGFMLQNGKVVTCRKELKTCKQVLTLVDRKSFSFGEVAKYLSQNGVKNRKGKPNWKHSQIKKIYEKWSGKL